MQSKEIKKLVEDLVKYFEADAKVEVEEKGKGYKVKIEAPKMAGHLIGKNGETLNEVQNLIRAVVAKKAGEYVPVTVDIGGYRQKREDELTELATQMAENVKNSKFAQELKPMSSYERMVIHTALADFAGVKVFSVGEGNVRRIRIEPAE